MQNQLPNVNGAVVEKISAIGNVIRASGDVIKKLKSSSPKTRIAAISALRGKNLPPETCMDELMKLKNDKDSEVLEKVKEEYKVYAEQYLLHINKLMEPKTSDTNSGNEATLEKENKVILVLSNLWLEPIDVAHTDLAFNYLFKVIASSSLSGIDYLSNLSMLHSGSYQNSSMEISHDFILENFKEAIYGLGNLMVQLTRTNGDILVPGKNIKPNSEVINSIIERLINLADGKITNGKQKIDAAISNEIMLAAIKALGQMGSLLNNEVKYVFDRLEACLDDKQINFKAHAIDVFRDLTIKPAKVDDARQETIIQKIIKYYRSEVLGKEKFQDFTSSINIALGKMFAEKELQEKINDVGLGNEVAYSLLLIAGHRDSNNNEYLLTAKEALDVLIAIPSECRDSAIEKALARLTPREQKLENTEFNADVLLLIRVLGELGERNLLGQKSLKITTTLQGLLNVENQPKMINGEVTTALKKLHIKNKPIFWIFSAIGSALLFGAGVMCLKYGSLLFLASSIIPPAVGLTLISLAIFLVICMCFAKVHDSDIKNAADALSKQKANANESSANVVPMLKSLASVSNSVSNSDSMSQQSTSTNLPTMASP
jgi:hypothetical protein